MERDLLEVLERDIAEGSLRSRGRMKASRFSAKKIWRPDGSKCL